MSGEDGEINGVVGGSDACIRLPTLPNCVIRTRTRSAKGCTMTVVGLSSTFLVACPVVKDAMMVGFHLSTITFHISLLS